MGVETKGKEEIEKGEEKKKGNNTSKVDYLFYILKIIGITKLLPPLPIIFSPL